VAHLSIVVNTKKIDAQFVGNNLYHTKAVDKAYDDQIQQEANISITIRHIFAYDV
jgi:hypothetical protein